MTKLASTTGLTTGHVYLFYFELLLLVFILLRTAQTIECVEIDVWVLSFKCSPL